MIIKMRIDDRLLHGQVAYSWKSALSYEAIVIADDNAANDEVRKMALKMSNPDGVRLAIRSVEDAAKLVKNPKLQAMKVFVIFSNPKAAYDFIEKIDEKPVLNIGGMQKQDDKVLLSPAVYVSKEDISYLDKIQEKNIEIEVRQVPNEKSKNYTSLKNKLSF
ncbi:PTS sugar transporter subunit IIB [Virgibacillus profundi]|uniref:PTS sugar transporter subunit IIB n=1 Tax=Virgibacillus profundi TaxID=2024555 RepID=A0A2A2IB65_9BACI|nr:PTS sugar transporter subunit IIB [Virgibacillus profundi]PAV28385.1 PTS sugar transporter subunit IIB [Virgibacillus profundi]PXY52253.1 PTS mannose/fructose/sorbose transporter subunit IIB [Virgibacillus profundi]